MRILFIGAGTIAQTYAGRLAAAGHDVTLFARGQRLEQLLRDGVRLERDGAISAPPVAVVGQLPSDPFDVVALAVRADQADAARPALADVATERVALMFNTGGFDASGPGLDGRAVFRVFPGVGGHLRDDGTVAYAEIAAQHTRAERTPAGAEEGFVAALREAGFAVDRDEFMGDWMATHTVFIAPVLIALARAGSAAALAADPTALTRMVVALREGFAALARRGIDVRPVSLRLLVRRLPAPVTRRMWQRMLLSPEWQAMGSYAVAARHTELPFLAAEARHLVAGSAVPALRELLADVDPD